ncbi:unnamed protein product [Cuscuta campestris]|uniref:Uncharacterized protein n=1 Tax=Cuscuta campestris TaxID=132261 RepID=A0A484NH55_9ASTE|nr:unnamed protein product [Cuscuta campestris]
MQGKSLTKCILLTREKVFLLLHDSNDNALYFSVQFQKQLFEHYSSIKIFANADESLLTWRFIYASNA